MSSCFKKCRVYDRQKGMRDKKRGSGEHLKAADTNSSFMFGCKEGRCINVAPASKPPIQKSKRGKFKNYSENLSSHQTYNTYCLRLHLCKNEQKLNVNVVLG
ncbi:hypothetical protein ATANTOWER_032954 [Ataeniobius toweri]|uniref:Uncharacterized protein n=1 Tax=Ataeniobius toweri TaxID=208326 RepID=A0ABU7A3F9_9TELE|nr:hypothetical protein [Ataeniobius toweri]